MNRRLKRAVGPVVPALGYRPVWMRLRAIEAARKRLSAALENDTLANRHQKDVALLVSEGLKARDDRDLESWLGTFQIPLLVSGKAKQDKRVRTGVKNLESFEALFSNVAGNSRSNLKLLAGEYTGQTIGILKGKNKG